jgi:hypothetical protein
LQINDPKYAPHREYFADNVFEILTMQEPVIWFSYDESWIIFGQWSGNKTTLIWNNEDILSRARGDDLTGRVPDQGKRVALLVGALATSPIRGWLPSRDFLKLVHHFEFEHALGADNRFESCFDPVTDSVFVNITPTRSYGAMFMASLQKVAVDDDDDDDNNNNNINNRVHNIQANVGRVAPNKRFSLLDDGHLVKFVF